MAKVVGISGAQGGGKSSLLNLLKERGYHVDDFRVSRAVQAQLGWKTLDNVLSSPQTMMDFQEEVFRQKYARDHSLKSGDGDEVILTERTFADICAYTAYWTWELHYQGQWLITEASKFLNSYAAKCARAQRECYSGVLLLPFMADTVKWQEDANRAKLDSVEQIYEGVESFSWQASLLTLKKLTITAKSVPDRADQVENFLRTL